MVNRLQTLAFLFFILLSGLMITKSRVETVSGGSAILGSTDLACVDATEKMSAVDYRHFDYDLFYKHLELLKKGNLPRTKKGALPYDGVLEFKTPEEFLAIVETLTASEQFDGLQISDFIERASYRDVLRLKNEMKVFTNSDFVTKGHIRRVLVSLYKVMHPVENLFDGLKNAKAFSNYLSGMPDEYIEQRIEFAVAHQNLETAFIALGFVRQTGPLGHIEDFITSGRTPVDVAFTALGILSTVMRGFIPSYIFEFDFISRDISSQKNIDLVKRIGLHDALPILQKKYGKKVDWQRGIQYLRKIYIAAALSTVLVVTSHNAYADFNRHMDVQKTGYLQVIELLQRLSKLDTKIQEPTTAADQMFNDYLTDLRQKHPGQKIDPNSSELKKIHETIRAAFREASKEPQ